MDKLTGLGDDREGDTSNEGENGKRMRSKLA